LIVGGLEAAGRFVAPAWRGGWGAMSLAGIAWAIWSATRIERPNSAWATVSLFAAALAFLAAQGSLWRLALGQGRPAPRLGRTELRLLIVWLLTVTFLGVLGLLLLVGVLCAAYAVASAGAGFVTADPSTWAPAVDDRGRVVVSILGFSGGAGLVWAASRIALAWAATMAGQHVQVLSTWPLTKHRAWRIALSKILVSAWPAALLLSSALARRSRWGAEPHSIWLLSLTDGLVIAGLWLPLNIGLMTYLFARLR
jgi:hypothetical protein